MSYQITKREQDRIDRGIESNRIASKEATRADLLARGNNEVETAEYLEQAFPTKPVINNYAEDEQAAADAKAEQERQEREALEAQEPPVVENEKPTIAPVVNEEKEQQFSKREMELMRRQIELETREKYYSELQSQNEEKEKARINAEKKSAAEAKERADREELAAAAEKELMEAFDGDGYGEAFDKQKVVKTLMKHLNKNLTNNSFSGNTNSSFDTKALEEAVANQIKQLEEKRIHDEFTNIQSSFMAQNKSLIENEDFVDLFNTKFSKEVSKGTSVKECYEKAKEQTLKALPHLVKATPTQERSKPNATLSDELKLEAERKRLAAGIAVSTGNSGTGSSSTREEPEFQGSYAMKLKLERANRLRGYGR